MKFRKGQRIYLVTRFMENISVSTLFGISKVAMQDESGMIGFLPVFRTKKQAVKDAGKKYQVLVMKVGEEEKRGKR